MQIFLHDKHSKKMLKIHLFVHAFWGNLRRIFLYNVRKYVWNYKNLHYHDYDGYGMYLGALVGSAGLSILLHDLPSGLVGLNLFK